VRGRLIWPFLAAIRQYDPEATYTGPPSPGFDPDFMEPVQIADGTAAGSHSARREKAEIRLRCQFEDEEEEKLRQLQDGAAPKARISLVFHFADLERAGMVDAATGDPKIHNGDRLDALYETNGTLVRSFANPPGMFATAVKPSGFGLSSLKRNLLVVTFEDRVQGAGAGT
jgi:hypothetical protein